MIVVFKDDIVLPLKDTGLIEINGSVMEKKDMVSFYVRINGHYGKFALYENGNWRVSGFGSSCSGQVERFIINMLTMAYQL